MGRDEPHASPTNTVRFDVNYEFNRVLPATTLTKDVSKSYLIYQCWRPPESNNTDSGISELVENACEPIFT